MKELVIVLLGLLLGGGASLLPTAGRRWLVVAGGAVVLGALWSRLMGEAELLALWDTAQALVAAAAGLLAAPRLRPAPA